MSDMFKISYRQGTSYARGTTMDAYLTEAQCERLYEKWDDAWGEPFHFRGGESAITAEMIIEAPRSEFLKTMGRYMGGKLLQIAEEQAG